MQQHGRVIYLYALPEVLVARLDASPEVAQRPTLTGQPVAEEMAEVLAQREALYQLAAHHQVDAMQSPDEVVKAILTSLSLARAS